MITDGTIVSNVEGTAVLAKNAGSVELTNVQVYATSGVNPLQCYGGTMTLNNVTASQSGSVTNGSVWYNSAIQVINQIKQNDEGQWVVYGQQAELIVNSGTFTINPDSITTGQVRINGTVVDNGNGTWTVK